MTYGSIPYWKVMKGFSHVNKERISLIKDTNCKVIMMITCFQSTNQIHATLWINRLVTILYSKYLLF
jgi:hypothetical protein